MYLHKMLPVQIAFLISMQSLYASDTTEKYTDPNKYIYKKVFYPETQAPAESLKNSSTVIQDETASDWLRDYTVRTKITEDVQDGKIIKTEETWTTKIPTYLTIRNLALVAALLVVDPIDRLSKWQAAQLYLPHLILYKLQQINNFIRNWPLITHQQGIRLLTCINTIINPNNVLKENQITVDQTLNVPEQSYLSAFLHTLATLKIDPYF